MDTQEDLYALLQVHPKATSDVIKKAYRALMLKNHPDKGGDEQLAQRLANDARPFLQGEIGRLIENRGDRRDRAAQ